MKFNATSFCTRPSPRLFSLLLAWAVLILSFSCSQDPKKNLFKYVSSSHSNLDFINAIAENDSINPSDCLNCFNGAGVGIGDFNNDGLSDIVFTGNQVSSALYLNRGDLVFEDISEKANFRTKSWITGVAIVDINADGLDDIYLSVAGINCDNNCYNELYVNQGMNEEGIPTFVEQAEAYGLDDGNYATQAVFFDYDMDGDLDVYITHNKNNTDFNRNSARPKNHWPDYLTDYLLRNDSVKGVPHPVFTNVSEQLHVNHPGFGLGVGIADFNNDQLIDVYVSNDFITEDLLYINRAHRDSVNPMFEESNKKYVSHMTTNGMGMDISDINNDGLWDIFVVDMLPNSYNRQKRVLGGMNYKALMATRNNGYTAQYMRNTLQLGNGLLHNEPVKSSEVSFLQGLSSTDWSWACLMVDFDNDGDKDIYVSNGYIKDIIDLDYVDFTSQKSTVFTPEQAALKQYVKDLPSIVEPNFFYEQKKGETFEDVSSTWIKSKPSLSNGVAYADFDLDGDLDMVVSNINSKAILMENRTSERLNNHFLRIKLKGIGGNTHAIGSKITIWHDSTEQHQFHSVIRGYLSSMEPVVHFGLNSPVIDSLLVIWPDGSRTGIREPGIDQVLELSQQESYVREPSKNDSQLLFVSTDSLLNFKHEENNFDEFLDQPLLMRQYSQAGPCLAKANIDGVPGDEIFIGGSYKKPGVIWFQDNNGIYFPKQELDSKFEDTDAVFFDADDDGDLDLYVASGGNEFFENAPNYLDRLYLNDGKGHFERSEESLPEMFQSTGCVRQVDIDHDGDLDLFIGSRITPFNYPKTPKSYILLNEGGKFDLQGESEISNAGMITDALWTDIDQDQWQDLVLVGEFMPVEIYQNQKGVLKRMPTKFFDDKNMEITTEGWWNCIDAADFDHDGDLDFIAGNQGLNGYVKPRKGYPVYVYNDDFDKNGTFDPLLGQYFEHEGDQVLYPVHSREDLNLQFTYSMVQFLTYEEYAQLRFRDILNIKDLDKETLRATTFETTFFENLGDGTFKAIPLPLQLQTSPVNDMLIADFSGGGRQEVVMVGNDFTAESNYGQFDAMTGLVLQTNGSDFKVLPSRDTGFLVQGQSKHLVTITDRLGRHLVVATQNNDKVKVFEFR